MRRNCHARSAMVDRRSPRTLPNSVYRGSRLSVERERVTVEMRLSVEQIRIIKQSALECFGPSACVRLFGSRMSDLGRGGDIDLLIDVSMQDPAEIARAQNQFMARIYARMGEQKIDLLIDYPGRSSHAPIFDLARRDGIPL